MIDSRRCFYEAPKISVFPLGTKYQLLTGSNEGLEFEDLFSITSNSNVLDEEPFVIIP